MVAPLTAIDFILLVRHRLVALTRPRLDVGLVDLRTRLRFSDFLDEHFHGLL